MSKYYAEKNSESTLQLFNKRTIYRAEMLTTYPNVVDLNRGERRYYGKVDNYFSPIVLENPALLKPLVGGSGIDTVRVLDFVADLFNEMALQFQQASARRQISAQDPFLSNLQPVRGYERPQDHYKEYQQMFIQQMRAQFRANQVDVKDFEEFMKEFMKLAPQVFTEMPFTYPGYIKSTTNSILTSGLAIEIADLDYQNDDEKIKSFLESPNWDFFVNACNKYGFMIDYNVPWRVICDIKAPEVASYMHKYDHEGPLALLEGTYQRASLKFLGTLPRLLLDIYNTVKLPRITRPVRCSGRLVNKTIIPQDYTLEQLHQKFDIYYFLRTYLKLRLWEEHPTMSTAERRQIIKEVLSVCRMRDSVVPIEDYFEKLINKPFDKKFSIGYIMKIQKPAMLAKQFSRGDIQAYSISTQNNTSY